MRLIIPSNTLYKILRRCLCTEFDKKFDHLQMTQSLKQYLNESPLKNCKEDNEWATRPVPAGTTLVEEIVAEPETTSVILFPGQGNQYVGMGKPLLTHSVVEDMFDAASSILGYNLKELCLSGPGWKLNKTEYCQPATLVCCLAAIEELKFRYPSAVANCIATCGFSLGEIAALVFAGSISFEDAVKITRVRAKAMEECSKKVPGGMMTILLGSDSSLKEAMADAKNECTSRGISDPICEIASYLFPECRVVAGHIEALKYLENNKSKYKLRKLSRLPVSGAFHTTLMKEAAEPFKESLKKLEIKKPLLPVISNATKSPYETAGDILKILPKQIYKPIKWEQILHQLYSRNRGKKFPHTYECGPGNSLTAVLKRTNNLAYQSCHKINT